MATERAKRRQGRPAYASARHIRILGWAAAGAFAATVLGVAVFDTVENPLCATQSASTMVNLELARAPVTDLAGFAHSIHLSEAVVLDAFPKEVRTGVGPRELPVVWEWLRRWPDPVVTIRHGRQLWHVRRSLPELRFVMQQGYWGFGDAGDALSGQMPVSEIGAIYAYTGGRGRHCQGHGRAP